MRKLKNNSLNDLLFPKNGLDVSDSTTLEVAQLGGSETISYLATISKEDCETVTYSPTIADGDLRNGLHTLRVLDSVGGELFNATILAYDNDSSLSHIIKDDADYSDFIKT